MTAAAPVIRHLDRAEQSNQTLQLVSPASYGCSTAALSSNRMITPCCSSLLKIERGEKCYGLKTSTELLRVLNRIWSLEEQHAASSSLVKTLKSELQHARTRIQELLQQRAHRAPDESSAWRSELDCKITATIQAVKDEFEDERRRRRQSESLHRKLGKELSELKRAFLAAVADLEKERRARRLVEDLCDEFANGIKSYEEEVRGLKQTCSKDHDHKLDRPVLHIAESWLDERIQIRIANSGSGLAKQSTITDRFGSEIRSFLQLRQPSNSEKQHPHVNSAMRDLALQRRRSLESVHLNVTAGAPKLADDDGDSVLSDLCVNRDGIQSHDKSKGSQRNGPESFSSDRFSALIQQRDALKDWRGSKNIKGQQTDTVAVTSTLVDAKITEEEPRLAVPSGSSAMSRTHACSSRIKLCCEGTAFFNERHSVGPVQPSAYRGGYSDTARAESSPVLSREAESTLKTKLLRARLEGRHARLQGLESSSSSTARK